MKHRLLANPTTALIWLLLFSQSASAQTAEQMFVLEQAEAYFERNPDAAKELLSRELTDEETPLMAAEQVLLEQIDQNFLSIPPGQLSKWVGCWKGADSENIGEFCFKGSGDTLDASMTWLGANATCRLTGASARLMAPNTAYFVANEEQVSCSVPSPAKIWQPSRVEGMCAPNEGGAFHCSLSIYRIYNRFAGIVFDDSREPLWLNAGVDIQSDRPPVPTKSEMLAEKLRAMETAMAAVQALSFDLTSDGKKVSVVEIQRDGAFNSCTIKWLTGLMQNGEVTHATYFTLPLATIDRGRTVVLDFDLWTLWAGHKGATYEPQVYSVAIRTQGDSITMDNGTTDLATVAFASPRAAAEFRENLIAAANLCQ